MSDSEDGTFFATLRRLFVKGIRYSTVIDLGCADGNLFLHLSELGLVPGAVPFNLEANPEYEESLEAIRAVAGGNFRIAAATDHEGEVEFTTSIHPYWSSLRPADDPYWIRVNRLTSTTRQVPATTLDTLRREFALTPPFLLKLDVQGAEVAALRGATNTLKETHIVVCEADVDDFHQINGVLAQNDFLLYDITGVQRLQDGTLGWFYPVYVNRALDHVRPKEFWDAKSNASTIRAQAERRQAILRFNAEALARMQALRECKPSNHAAALVGRNAQCPCGSGKKYKHCCGTYT